MDLTRYMPFFGRAQTTRFAYLRLAALEAALDDDRVLDALIEVLSVPGKPAVLRALSPKEKFAAIEHQIDHYRATPTSLWRDVPPPYVLAASIQRSDLPDKIVLKLFADVKAESLLCKPVGDWFRAKGFEVFEEIPLGTCRADLVARHVGGWLSAKETVAVELKNEIGEFGRGLDQMTTYREYVDKVYLACTPWLAADYLLHHAEGLKVKHYDHDLLDRRLKDFGLGLLLVEGDEVVEYLAPTARPPNRRKLEELALALAAPKARRPSR